MWKRRKSCTILFLAQTDFRQVGWTTIEELIKRDKMEGDARVITEPLMRNSHGVFFLLFSFLFHFFYHPFSPPFSLPLHRCLHLAGGGGENNGGNGNVYCPVS